MRNNAYLMLAIIAVLGFAGGFFTAKSIRSAPLANLHQNVLAPVPVVSEGPDKIKRHSFFTWSQVESDDIGQYIANLRRIGCPERTIGDIIRACVYSTYQARVNAILNPLVRYWNTTAEMKSIDAQVRTIRGERDKFLAELHLVDSTFDPKSCLPPEKQSFVGEALRLYPKAEPDPSWSSQDWQAYLQARKARIAYLAQYLTPEELLDYRISQDGNPSGITRLLQDIRPSDDELKKVFEALDGEDLSHTNGFLAANLQPKLQQALGNDRYSEYLSLASSPDHLFNMIVSTENLSDDQVQQLKQLLKSADSMSSADYRQATASILQHPSAVRTFLMLSHKPINP